MSFSYPYPSFNRRSCTAMIDGKEVFYTLAGRSIDAYDKLPNRIYLGIGHIYRVSGIIQSQAGDMLHFWLEE